MRRTTPRANVVGAVAGVMIALASGCSEPPSPGSGRSTVSPDEGVARDPWFDDVTARSGITAAYRNGEETGHFAIIESLGGGVALFDYDADGLLDLFVPGGGRYERQSALGLPCKLYRNCGGFRFEDVSTRSGLDAIDFPYNHGAAAADYDCDGWPDLLVTGYDRLVLLHNVAGPGGRRFVDVTPQSHLTERLWSTSAGWGDLDADGFPELYVAHYGDWGFGRNHPTDCAYDGRTRDVCPPRRFQPLPHTLYRNNRDGTFADISATVKLRTDGRGIGVLMVDVNNDGRPDVYTANDTDDNFLYLNVSQPGTVRLAEKSLMAGVARDDRGVANGSMGVAAADYNHTGQASLLVTNYENELPALYRNRTTGPEPRFLYDTLASGLSVVGGSFVSWGVGFQDFDLDGWDDILIVSGHAIRFPTKIDRRQKPTLFRNANGKFRPVPATSWPYFREAHNARGAAVGDLDNDGHPDVVISHLNEPVTVLKNVTAGHHWIGVQLAREQHFDPTGARVTIETKSGRQTKFVTGGGSYGSTSDRALLFGLGTDTAILNATVYWPNGREQSITFPKLDTYWEVAEGSALRPVRQSR